MRASRFPLVSASVFMLSLGACSSSPTSPASDTDAGADGPAIVGGGACTVTKKGTAGVALQGNVLAPSGPLVGEVFVGGDGKIACVAASCSTTAGYDTATQISCPSGVISPGLINAHDHTDYNDAPPVAHGTTRWTNRQGWRTGAGGETPLSTPKPSSDAKVVSAAELRYVLSGVTSLVSSGGQAGFARNLADFKNPTFLEGANAPTTFFDTFPLGDQKGVEITSGCLYPKIRSATTAAAGAAYAPHIAEGINAASENEFTCASGAAGLVTAKTSIIHAVGLNAKDIDVIAKANARVIWSPRSNIDLYGNTASITEMKQAGITLALGTDWLASGSMNLLRELHCADSLNAKYFHNALSDRDLWALVTGNAAIAAGFDTQLGALEVGKLGDITVFDGSASKDYRAVIDAGVEDVQLVLRGGKVMFGDADLVSALSPTCEAFDVCGRPKQVCVDAPGLKLADLTGAVASVYPLFFCKDKTPDNEPSCVPFRDSYPLGTSATDRDGDGVADATDNCPDVFNPPRPMDGDKQSDVDGDGQGDACDATPLAP